MQGAHGATRPAAPLAVSVLRLTSSRSAPPPRSVSMLHSAPLPRCSAPPRRSGAARLNRVPGKHSKTAFREWHFETTFRDRVPGPEKSAAAPSPSANGAPTTKRAGFPQGKPALLLPRRALRNEGITSGSGSARPTCRWRAAHPSQSPRHAACRGARSSPGASCAPRAYP